ncbi:MAG: argininosuccinate lyase [Planctomycetes bacterium]|jgi:argininosuccinate lyase|nr:argininosuccinate lyase [Planctomycetota bacterium]
MTDTQRSWEKRLAAKPDELTVDYVESLSYDRRLYKYDIVGSIAHAAMLAQQKLITQAEFRAIEKGLVEISEDIEAGRFEFDKAAEDIHMAIESALIRRIGEPGAKLHTGRSRNDQVATDIRLWLRDEIETLRAGIVQLQQAFVALAARHTEDLMPAYTHLQRAQPIVIAAYLLSFVEQLERDSVRLRNCRTLLNASPLGAGAIAGSTLAIDRQSTARQLGFADIVYNSIDAVSDRDFGAEFIFDCALMAAHLSRFAEDWILFSSNEFGFLRIADAFCTSSSMMPQKRNPDVLELMRAKTGAIYGALVALLTILKGQPSGYNRDLQEDKIHIFSAADTTAKSLEIAAAIVAHTAFRTQEIAAGLDAGFLDATALAEYLVTKGIPFRQAHGIVGALVARCEKQGRELGQLSLEEFREGTPVIEADVYDHLGAASVVRRYVSAGAAGPEQARRQLAFWQEHLAGQGHAGR